VKENADLQFQSFHKLMGPMDSIVEEEALDASDVKVVIENDKGLPERFDYSQADILNPEDESHREAQSAKERQL